MLEKQAGDVAQW